MLIFSESFTSNIILYNIKNVGNNSKSIYNFSKSPCFQIENYITLDKVIQ